MKQQAVELIRFTASEGHSLKWMEKVIHPQTRKEETVLRYSEYTAVIDVNKLVGDVKEIPIVEYKEWYENLKYNLGISSL